MRIEIRPPADFDMTALSEQAMRAVEATMQGAAMLVANDAKRRVQRGPKSGRTYVRRGIAHQASAPGEPPATDTGKLAGSIVAAASGLTAYVEARSEYGRWLEYGTRRILPRPFMVPAAEANRERIGELIRSAVASAMNQWQTKR